MNERRANQLLQALDRAARRPDQAVRYVTIWQGIVCGAAALMGLIGVIGGAFINVEGRLDRVEYQNQISIQDRADLRKRVELDDRLLSEIAVHLARIDANLEELARKAK